MNDDQPFESAFFADEPEQAETGDPTVEPTEPAGSSEEDALLELRQALIDAEAVKEKEKGKTPRGLFRRPGSRGQDEEKKEPSEPVLSAIVPYQVRPNQPEVTTAESNDGSVWAPRPDDDFRARFLGHTDPFKEDATESATPLSLEEAHQQDQSQPASFTSSASTTGRRLSPHTGYLDGDTWNGDVESEAPQGPSPEVEKAKENKGNSPFISGNAGKKPLPRNVISYQPQNSFWNRLNRWYDQLMPLEKGMVWLLNLAVLGLCIWLVILYFNSRGIEPAVAEVTPTRVATTVPGEVPIPVGLELPGGWHFAIQRGQIVDGKWTPLRPEWLAGTEVRRVVAIPWSRQVEAVVKTLEPGDIIKLEMSNGDLFGYKVESVSQVPASDASILNDAKPSLALILYASGVDNRWVVFAIP
jgi:hypothetical protein